VINQDGGQDDQIIGLDIAKNVFRVHGVDETGRPALRRRVASLDANQHRLKMVDNRSTSASLGA
jgi:hypothetical protein